MVVRRPSIRPSRALLTLSLALVGTLAIAGCAGMMQQTELPPAPAVTGNASELNRVATSPLDEYWPRPSWDGKSLLIHQRDDTKQGDERFSIVKVDVGSPGRTLVSDRFADQPAWFPDNQTFVYASSRTGRSRLVKSRIAGAGGGMTFVTTSAAGDNETSPDVSPDGKKIAFATVMKGEPFIAMVGVDGSNFTVYTPGSNPRWSPDGKRIVFDRTVGQKTQIFLLDLGGGAAVTQISTGNVSNSSPAWSPDGKRITYISDRDGTGHVYIMNADGTQETQLTSGLSTEFFPAWAVDGYIYFASNAGGNQDIWRIKPLTQ